MTDHPLEMLNRETGQSKAAWKVINVTLGGGEVRTRGVRGWGGALAHPHPDYCPAAVQRLSHCEEKGRPLCSDGSGTAREELKK